MTNISGQPPGGIFTPRHVRALKLAVAIMSVLLVSGIVALVFGVARQVSKLGKAGHAGGSIGDAIAL